jgi:hypothetical protein
LTIGSNISIVGPGANLLTVSAQRQVQVFTVNSGAAASISGLTIDNGHAPSDGERLRLQQWLPSAISADLHADCE